jgi:PAS domain S-box-containing protein
MKVIRIPSAAILEEWPWYARVLLGCALASLAGALDLWAAPFRIFPMLLPFPAILLCCWFLGMWGGVACALTEAILLDWILSRTHTLFPNQSLPPGARLAAFLGISILLGWTIRRLGQQRTQLHTQELRQRLALAQAERQLAEERARASEALLERDEVLQVALVANNMGLWGWDLRLGTTYWSDEIFRIAGREPGSMVPSHEAWISIIHPDDAAMLQKAMLNCRDQGIDCHEQYRMIWPDGSIRWIESQGKCQRDSEGRVTRVVGVLADITQRKRTEEAMLRTEKLAVAGRLAASVAHEINNPLEAVGNLLYLISLDESREAARAHARQAHDELMRVSMITQQTLQFHRQTGAPAGSRLSEIVATVIALFRGRLRNAQVTVEVRTVQEVPIICMTSEVQQICANMLSNAIEAMPKGGRLILRLRPSLDWRDGRTPGMRITAIDTGIGMNRETMRRMDEPFFTTKTETGTGLGMWVVRQLLKRHQGDLRVWSSQRAGKSGTAFSLFLPLGETAATLASPE